MITDWFEQLKAACGRVGTAHRTGTGYLAATDQMITCEHIVREVGIGGTVSVFIAGQAITATVIEKDELNDSAILALKSAPAGVAPLRFAGKCLRQAVWDGYGFPGIGRGAALPLRGTVMDPASQDRKQRPSLLLFSDQIATKDDVHGFSGSPVLVDGYVVGHLKRIISDDDEKPAFGYVFASPSEEILRLLKTEPEIAVVDPDQPYQICIPGIPEDRIHAFVSSNSSNRAFAQRLTAEVLNKGFRVSSRREDLTRAESAVIVVTSDYLNAPASRAEADRIRAERSARGLRIIPVVMDNARIPDAWMPLLAYHFAGASPVAGPMLEQVLYAIAGQRPPVRAIAGAVPPVPADSVPATDTTQARGLINAGLPEVALRYLPASDQDLTVRRLRALALAKNRQIDEARAALEQLRKEGKLDAETASLLAGRYRQLWEDSGEKNWFIASLATYRKAWESTQDPYPGINAASMLLWNEEPAESQTIAQSILGLVDPETADFWGLATIAQAYVLVGHAGEALRFYTKMIESGPDRYENIATARRTLRRDLEHLNISPEPFERILSLPKVAAFVGHDMDRPDRPEPRFPPDREAEVRAAIAARIKSLRIMYGVSSADAGSDIIFLEEMKKRNAYVRVILPCSRGVFVQKYLDDLRWRVRFDRAMDHPRAEVVELAGDTDTMWEHLLPELWKWAETMAKQFDDHAELIAVWDGKPGFVHETISYWQSQGAPVGKVPLYGALAEGKGA